MIQHWVTRKRSKVVAVVEIEVGDLLGHLDTPEHEQELRRKLNDAFGGLARDLVDVGHILQTEGEEGHVKWFDESLGYGFITTRDSTDIFVHHKGIAGDEAYKSLKKGQRVKFKRRQGRTSFEAYDVTEDGDAGI